jgi:O-antigen/teichoic acid export membrane protein
VKNKKLLIAGFGLTVANVIGGGLGYIYQILMGRFLTPADFALFNAIFATYIIITSPLAAAMMAISKQTSTLRATDRLSELKPLYISSCKKILLFLFPILCVIAILRDMAAEFFKTTNEVNIWLLIFMLALSPFLTVNNAFLQGLQKFKWMAGSTILSIAAKLLLSLVFIYLGLRATGVLAASAIVSIGLISLGGWLIFSSITGNSVAGNPQPVNPLKIQTLAPILVANLGFTLLTQLDVVLVNWLFPPDQAGLYAAAAVYGKAILYLPGGLILALFPAIAENQAKNNSSMSMIIHALAWTAGICGAVAFIYFVFGTQIIEISYGKDYSTSGQLLGWYGIAILPMALVVIAENILIAQGRVLFCWLFLAILPFELLAIYIWHSELWMIILAIGVSGFCLFIAGYVLLWLEWRKRHSLNNSNFG